MYKRSFGDQAEGERQTVPLLGFLIPTLVISTLMFVYMECPPIIQLIGLYACVIGATISYYAGIHMVLNDRT
jgi:hypothetical protein